MGDASEALVLAKCQRGEQEGFGQFLDMFRGYIYSLCSRMSADREDALDLCQESYLAIFRGIKSVRPGLPLKPWVRRVTLNVCLNEIRRKGSRLPAELTFSATAGDDGGVFSPEPQTESREAREVLLKSIQSLDPDYRTAVILFHQEGLSYQEIADETGWPVGTVKTNLFRARKALAETMKDWKVR